MDLTHSSHNFVQKSTFVEYTGFLRITGVWRGEEMTDISATGLTQGSNYIHNLYPMGWFFGLIFCEDFAEKLRVILIVERKQHLTD